MKLKKTTQIDIFVLNAEFLFCWIFVEFFAFLFVEFRKYKVRVKKRSSMMQYIQLATQGRQRQQTAVVNIKTLIFSEK